jgi:hypothetical protein
MRNLWLLGWAALIPAAGCNSLPSLQDDSTRQVPSIPAAESRPVITQTKVSYAPASQDIIARVDFIARKLIGGNPTGLRPDVIPIGSPDPEIFHVGLHRLYITETLVRQCATDGQLAAVLANELGRMVAEREKLINDEVRSPEPLPPMCVPGGGIGGSRDRDPLNNAELAYFEKQHSKQPRKLTPPNPQLVARTFLANGGFPDIELDNAMPILQNAARFTALEDQSKGSRKQSGWTAP